MAGLTAVAKVGVMELRLVEMKDVLKGLTMDYMSV